MSNPLVCGILLTRDRPELARRAVECFRSQTYENKRLLIWDSGREPLDVSFCDHYDFPIWTVRTSGVIETIGTLRNQASAWAVSRKPNTDILMHFDDDDWSAPERMADQVKLLETSGADVVGYSDMLFWRAAGIGRDKDGTSRGCPVCFTLPCSCNAQAWLYTAPRGGCPVLGTSLAYKRSYWEKNPFPDQPRPGNVTSEYKQFVLQAKTASYPHLRARIQDGKYEPMMVARIHAGNSQKHSYDLDGMAARGVEEWKRVAAWDEKLREIMK